MSITIEDKDEDAPFLEEILRRKGVPRLTRWKDLCGFGFWLILDQDTPTIRFRHNVCEIFPVFIEIIIIIWGLLEWYYNLLPVMTHRTLALAVMLFFWLPGLILLIVTWLKDPGFLPFFYPATDRQTFTSTELRYGTACNDVQKEWARKQPRPARIVFSEGAGRYVIRGDHNCFFTGNWVGLHNHRYFVLAITYLMFADLIFVLSFLWVAWQGKLAMGWIKATALIIITLGFLFLLSQNVFGQLFLIGWNMTMVDRLKHWDRGQYDRGCLNNYEEVCGPRKYICLWWLPIPLPRTIDGFGYGPIDQEILNDGRPGEISAEFMNVDDMAFLPFS